MANDEVQHERRGPAFWMTINRPQRRNALTAAVIEGLAEGYRVAEADPDIRVIVLTGAGEDAFSAGQKFQFRSGAAQ
jgi:methylglutaconyl-CoA hydratase